MIPLPFTHVRELFAQGHRNETAKDIPQSTVYDSKEIINSKIFINKLLKLHSDT